MHERTDKTSAPPDLNLSYLKDLASGSIEFMIEMIDIFLEQTPLYFDQLKTAIAQQDWKTVADMAHKIKPTLAFMGVDQAREDMQALEHNARNLKNLDAIEPEFLKLQETCVYLFSQLEVYKKELEAEL